MDALKPYLKALTGGVAAAISFAIPVVDDGLIASEILGIILAGLTAGGLTYGVPNLPRKNHVAPAHRKQV